MEWKTYFVEHNMPINIHTTRWRTITNLTNMWFTISKEDIRFGYKGKFVRVVWPKIWPTLTPKNFKEMIVRFCLEK